MNLVASMIVRNELGRYLEPCIEHLLEFCDEVLAYDDGSTDGTKDWLAAQDRVFLVVSSGTHFFEHEGRARGHLLHWTLDRNPTHILAIDADELVTDGAAIRAACEADEGPGAWTLEMAEVWKATDEGLWTRDDGGWRPHRCPILYRVPKNAAAMTINDRALACGREPETIRRMARAAPESGSSILHLGWTNEADRKARHDRYVQNDGGRFHNRRHLDSILWPDRRVRLKRRDWPPALEPWKPAILGRANQMAVA